MISGLSTALFIFGFGVFLAAAASGTTYLAQVNYETKKIKKAERINNVTIVIVILSYLSFLGGGLKSYLTVQDWASQKAATAARQQGKIKDSGEFRETNNELSEQEVLDKPTLSDGPEN